MVVFVRGHTPEPRGLGGQSRRANPDGAERAVWAARTAGAGRVAARRGDDARCCRPTAATSRSRRTARSSRTRSTPRPGARRPSTRVRSRWSRRGAPTPIPAGRRTARRSRSSATARTTASSASSTSRKRTVTFLAPSVDRDTSPDVVARRQAHRVHPPAGPAVRPAGAAGKRAGSAIRRGRRTTPRWPGRAAADSGARARGRRGRRAAAASAARRRAAAGRGARPLFRDAARRLPRCVLGGRRATGEAHEVWHPAPTTRPFGASTSIQWAGDSVLFPPSPGSGSAIRGARCDDGSRPAPPATHARRRHGRETAFTSLSPDGRTLFYCNNRGDIDRRHVWKVPTSGGDAGAVDQAARASRPTRWRLPRASRSAMLSRRRAAAAVDRPRAGGGRRGEGRLPDAAEGVPARAAGHSRERADEGGRRPGDPQPALPAARTSSRASGGRRSSSCTAARCARCCSATTTCGSTTWPT